MSPTVASRRRLGWSFWTFIALMVVLTALFVGLGVWQMNRQAWKDALIARVADRLTQRPYDLPPLGEWPSLDLEVYGYHPITLTGHFIANSMVRVFTNLTDAKGKYDGPGYWVMTAFRPEGGGTVFVNRGFVPQSSGNAFATGPDGTQPSVTLTGIGVAPEATGAFTPPPDTRGHIEWVRDPARLATMAGIDPPVLGLTIDVTAGAPGALPQGGETVVEFPNNHLGYVFTWFGFALLTPCLLGYWIWRQLRPAVAGPKSAQP